MILTTVLTALFTVLLNGAAAMFKFVLLASWSLAKAVLWALSPVWLWAAIIGVISGCFTTPAKASWLSSFWEPDPKLTPAVQAAREASARAAHLAAELSASRQANQALAQAASVANEAAKAQAHQHASIADAITALSSERTQLAARLGDFTQVLRQDSAWAAALQAAGPVLVAVAVLALGCAAIWMVSRASDRDSELATVLVDEITGTGAGTLLAASGHRRPNIGSPTPPQEHPARNLIDIKPDQEEFPESREEQELPF